MSITITDPALLALLRQATGPTEILDSTGRVIATFWPSSMSGEPGNDPTTIS